MTPRCQQWLPAINNTQNHWFSATNDIGSIDSLFSMTAEIFWQKIRAVTPAELQLSIVNDTGSTWLSAINDAGEFWLPVVVYVGGFLYFFVRELTKSAFTESRTKVFFEKLKIGFLHQLTLRYKRYAGSLTLCHKQYAESLILCYKRYGEYHLSALNDKESFRWKNLNTNSPL